MIYWFTGQPGAGKTTLALALQARLRLAGRAVVHLDGEFVRHLMDNRDYTESGRFANIRVGQLLAARIADDGIEVVASFVSPYRSLREAFKARGDVIEVYVHTTELRGRESYFVGNYEPPLTAFVDMDTTRITVESCLDRLRRWAPPSGPVQIV